MTRWWAGLARLLSGGQQKASAAPPPPPAESCERPVVTSADYPIARRAEDVGTFGEPDRVIDDWSMWEDQLRVETEAKTRRLRGER